MPKTKLTWDLLKDHIRSYLRVLDQDSHLPTISLALDLCDLINEDVHSFLTKEEVRTIKVEVKKYFPHDYKLVEILQEDHEESYRCMLYIIATWDLIDAEWPKSLQQDLEDTDGSNILYL